MTLKSVSAICVAAIFSINSSYAIDQTYTQRLRAQLTDISPAVPGRSPVSDAEVITPEMAWNRDQFNPNRIICLSRYEGKNLAGFANYDAVKKLLPAGVEPVLQDFAPGVKGVPTFIASSLNLGYMGCTCPPQFEEFAISVVIKDPGLENPATLTPATAHLAPLYWATNHLKRQETMVRKFSIPEQFAGIPRDPNGEKHIGWIKNGEEIKGIYLKDQSGREIFRASRGNGVIPAATVVVPMVDFITYSLQDTLFQFDGNRNLDLFKLNRHRMSGQFFRLQEFNHLMSYNPLQAPPAESFFIPGVDQIKMEPASAVGRVLTQIQFQPLMWTSDTLNNGVAWTPKPMASALSR